MYAASCLAKWLSALLAVRKADLNYKLAEADEEECAVCQSAYTSSDEIVTLPCTHSFHTPCIDKWFKTGKKTCPYCRQPAAAFTGGENTPANNDSDDDTQSVYMLNG